MIADLRQQVQAHIGRLSVAFHDTNKTGALVARIMSDVEGLRNLVGTGLVELVGSVMTAIIRAGDSAAHQRVHDRRGVRDLWSFRPDFEQGRRHHPADFPGALRINAEVTGRLTESLAGVRVVKGYRAEAREDKVFADRRSAPAGQRAEDADGDVRDEPVVVRCCSGLVSALITYLGARRMLAGTMTIGTFVTYGLFLGLLVAPIYQIVTIGTQFSDGMAGLERTSDILDEKQEDDDPRRTVAIGTVRGDVVFEDVGFAYQEGKPVLHEVSFHARPDSVTALVGPSGAGKSTITGLIAAFYVPTSGRVLVDGTDLSTVRLDSYRTQLGVVLQETFLFDGTIRDNVIFSRPDASEEDFLAACRIARVDEFAETFAEQYDTVVGERGVKLSGGQRQRISIARAILADPRILILDEATSSLDSESEALIQEGLSYLMRGRTTFVIAHRLSTIRRADQILVIEEGRIIERGNHASLYALGGRYFDLYTKQHGLQENLFLAPGEGDSVPGEPAGSSVGDGANGGGQNGSAKSEPSIAAAARLLRGRES